MVIGMVVDLVADMVIDKVVDTVISYMVVNSSVIICVVWLDNYNWARFISYSAVNSFRH